MTQDDVRDWLILNCDCHIYKERVGEDGIYYSIRKNGSKKIAIVYPVKTGIYKPGAVKSICEYLDVEVPAYGRVDNA